jgi:hypothetical protein
VDPRLCGISITLLLLNMLTGSLNPTRQKPGYALKPAWVSRLRAVCLACPYMVPSPDDEVLLVYTHTYTTEEAHRRKGEEAAQEAPFDVAAPRAFYFAPTQEPGRVGFNDTPAIRAYLGSKRRHTGAALTPIQHIHNRKRRTSS